MDFHKVSSIRPEIWNRKIINAYWIVSLIYIIGQFLIFLLRLRYLPNEPENNYIIRYVARPDIVILIILLFTELYFRHIKKHHEYLIIISAMLIAYTMLIFISPRIKGAQIVLILPILISIFYFTKKIMIYTCAASSAVLTILYIASPYQREYISVFEFVLIILMLVAVAIIGVGILDKGTEMMKNLEKLIYSEEQLMIENRIMDKLSKADALTGLYNHKTFHEYIDTAINQCSTSNIPLHLAIVDIDDFKKVNDTYGHWVGDIVLKEVAQILLTHITADDFVARYGGEEFAIVFIGRSAHETFLMIEKARQAIENKHFIQLEDRAVTVSIGLHSYTKNDGKEVLFKAADENLYKAKGSGKNKTIYTQGMPGDGLKLHF
ncbi:MAG: GGDEF domain-containing protein [Bacillota bacterium]|nr:GGDEF domain-containing protein [Bacillota bacterium]